MKHLLFFLLIPFYTFAQNCEGILLNATTELPVAYANIGVLGKSAGTVTGEDGRFQLDLSGYADTEILKISMIGYQSLEMDLGVFKKECDGERTWFLKETTYELDEVVVVPVDYVEKRLGNKMSSGMVQAGFSDNLLGYELGTLMKNKKKKAIIEKVQINFSSCTYDSIFLRLNVYKMNGKLPGENVLTQPIYLSYPKEKVTKNVMVDLKEYYIEVEGDFLVTLEFVKELGEDGLYFCSGFFGSKTFYRETSQADWEKVSAGIGIGISAFVLQEK